ncbi:MAG: helix-turn-helix transcriptional regulator [Asticcacaulis sp.]|nr:helix-turn-helix transcriptional regulator [Asticcacaulis sp.]
MVRTTSPAKPAAKPVPDRPHRSMCPINLTLEKVGDAWSMLIIRDLMLRGHTGYQAFLRSEEKIATNILADRLARLEQYGLISKGPDPSDARKFIYALTEKGADLAPLLVELALYSIKHEKRVDMPKDVVSEMQRNKPVFVSRLIRHSAPKAKTRSPRKSEPREPAEETLSLF